jgi:hypothetical protein
MVEVQVGRGDLTVAVRADPSTGAVDWLPGWLPGWLPEPAQWSW